MKVVFNDSALDKLLNDPKGPVGRHLHRIGLKIYAGAMVMSGLRTGDLRKRMYIAHRRVGAFQEVTVGSKSKHAYLHHEGTKPHQILPANGRVIRLNIGGRVVYAHKVAHPGTKPNPYLTVPMRRAVSGRNR